MKLEINDLDKITKRVVAEQVEIEISFTPDEMKITITPWKPFKYSCPYREVEP